ncbi:VTT domain-containing protein [Gammaproteobacteria bacterium AS21]
MDILLNLISEYGSLSYLLLFMYCAMKSGVLPLFAGVAAQYGYLDLSWVIISVFLGGYLGDELRFWLVRRYGDNFVASRPKLAKLADGAKLLLARYGLIYLFIYRYPKGMRTIGALPVALTDIKWRKFTLLNGASALLWSAVLVGVGYLFGRMLQDIIGEQWRIVSVLLLLVFIVLSYIGWRSVRDSVQSTN